MFGSAAAGGLLCFHARRLNEIAPARVK